MPSARASALIFKRFPKSLCVGRELAFENRKSSSSEGYRELRSAAEVRKLLNRKIVEQGAKCAFANRNLSNTTTVVCITLGSSGASFFSARNRLNSQLSVDSLLSCN